MDREVPIYFDTVIIDSPTQQISCEDSSACRLHVGVFYKYKNRNRSFITDEYADFLIKSATRGNCPVVGFFNPEDQDWAAHTGPTLANGYGYIEKFDGWVPFQDTDGVTRDYATFSVVLFTDYYEEACKIKGQHQSMELDPKSITGEWVDFDGEEYFVYTNGNMLGLCVIGSHEPCFSVSHFFSKNDDTYKSQYEKFSSLLFNLKAQVEEAENKIKGGEQQMNEFEENKTKTPAGENTNKEEFSNDSQTNDSDEEKNTSNEEKDTSNEFEKETEEKKEPSTAEVEFEKLQAQFNELQNSFNELQTKFNEATESINTLNQQAEELRDENSKLQSKVSEYQAAEQKIEEEKRNELFEKYEEFLSEEEIMPIKSMAQNFSYEVLEGKLAIAYANNKMNGEKETTKVPLPPQEEDSFATFMQKYKK